ncbi:MAG: CSLREA domain-containing protein, partial [Pyrinomonadaceae bacterium]
MKNRTDMHKQGQAYTFVIPKLLILTGLAVTIVLVVSSLSIFTRTAETQEIAKQMPTLRREAAVLNKIHEIPSHITSTGTTVDADLSNPEAITRLTSTPRQTNSTFGGRVAVSGDTAIVSDRQDGVFVFVRSGTTWTQQQRLIGSDTVSLDSFGSGLAISGDTAIVGANMINGVTQGKGAAYVFTRSGSTWTQQQKLIASDGQAGDRFGESVAISGDIALVGATGDDDALVDQNKGSVYVFVRSGTTWTENQKLLANDAGVGDLFGTSVAISGNTAIIGAQLDSFGSNSAQGSAYVFVQSGTTWSQQQKFTGSDSTANNRFGISVAISGNTAIVGAHQFGRTFADLNIGAAYIFFRNGTIWSQQQKLIASDQAREDEFGLSVGISGDTTIVGSPFADIGGNRDQGATYVFLRCKSTWTQAAKLTVSGGTEDDSLGSVAIAGATAIIGAPGEDTGLGAAYAISPPELPQPACETEIEVNITTDEPDADLEDTECDVDEAMSGPQCSLRAAIQTANDLAGSDTIAFDIPGGGVQTISPGSQLPPITERVSIDGTTQPGFVNKPVIELNGSNTSINSNGFVFALGSSSSSLK